jgi:hypothetical protein
MNVVFSANCNAASLQRIRGVSAGTQRSVKGKLRRSISPEGLRVLDDIQLNGRDIPFVNNVTYLGVTFDRRMKWRNHMERTVAKALLPSVSTYSLFEIGCLSKNIKLMLCIALNRSVITYACSTCENVADDRLLNCSACRTHTPRYWKS